MTTLVTSGTTTTNGTEQTLATDTTNKVYVLAIDTANMVNGDVIEIKIKTKVLSGGTERIAYYTVYAHAQGEPIKYSPPVPANISYKVTLKRVSGTDRAYDWAVLGL